MEENTYRVAVTAMIRNKEGKYLITKRTADKKRWPNRWTFPGGQVQDSDFIGIPTHINNQWYNVLENVVFREVKEETGLEIWCTKYLCSIAVPGCIILSFTSELYSPYDFPTLQKDECDDWRWVTRDEMSKFDLIDGLLEEVDLYENEIAFKSN